MLYKRKTEAILMILPAVILLSIFIYFSVALNFYNSLFRWDSFSIEKVWVGLKNYIRMASDEVFWTAFRNTVLFAIFSVIFQVGVALILAGVLEQKWLGKFGTVCRTIYFLPSMMSITVVALLWQLALNAQTGFVNQVLEAIGLGVLAHDWLGDANTAIFAAIFCNQWQYLGYTMLLFIIGIQKVPRDYIEAAYVDGCTPVSSFFHVVIPNIKGSILLNTAVTIIGSFKTFEGVFALTFGGPGRASEVLGTMLYREAFRNDAMGYASAIGVVIFVVTFALSLIQIKMYDIKTTERRLR